MPEQATYPDLPAVVPEPAGEATAPILDLFRQLRDQAAQQKGYGKEQWRKLGLLIAELSENQCDVKTVLAEGGKAMLAKCLEVVKVTPVRDADYSFGHGMQAALREAAKRLEGLKTP